LTILIEVGYENRLVLQHLGKCRLPIAAPVAPPLPPLYLLVYHRTPPANPYRTPPFLFYDSRMILQHILTAAGPAIAVAALTAVAWGLGFRRQVTIRGEEAARALIAQFEPQVKLSEILLDREGRTALARRSQGGFVVVRVVGDRFAVRDFPENSVRITRDEDVVSVRFDDLGFPPLELHLDPSTPHGAERREGRR